MGKLSITSTGVKKASSSRRKACDKCRQYKKKCDGGLPCSRCLHSKKTCTYPPGAVPTPAVSTPAVKKEPDFRVLPEESASQHNTVSLFLDPTNPCINNSLPFHSAPNADMPFVNGAIHRNYLQTYFQEIHPIRIFYRPVDISIYDQPTSASRQLQYYAVMATVMRVMEPARDAYRYYEQQARRMAVDLMDEFSVETMFGFQLLAYHYWGEDTQKSDHYRSITLSLGRQIAKNKQLSPKELDMLVRIQLVTVGMTDIAEYNIENDLRRALRGMDSALSTVIKRDLDDGTAKVENVINWLHFRAGLANCAQDLNSDDEGDSVMAPFRHDQQEFNRLKRMEGIIQKFLAKVPNSNVRKSAELLMYAFMVFIGGQCAVAISCIREAISLLSAQELLSISSPYLYSLLHNAVRIAANQGELELARQVNSVQRQLALVLPSSRTLTEKDRSLLHRLATISASASSPAVPVKTEEQQKERSSLFASTDFLWDSSSWSNNNFQAAQFPTFPEETVAFAPSATPYSYPSSYPSKCAHRMDPRVEELEDQFYSSPCTVDSSSSPSPIGQRPIIPETEFIDDISSLLDELPLSGIPPLLDI